MSHQPIRHPSAHPVPLNSKQRISSRAILANDLHTTYRGGEEVLLDVGGQDATEAFEDVGHSDEAREILEGLKVGKLKRVVRVTPQPIPPISALHQKLRTSSVEKSCTKTPTHALPPSRHMPHPRRASPPKAYPSSNIQSRKETQPRKPQAHPTSPPVRQTAPHP